MTQPSDVSLGRPQAGGTTAIVTTTMTLEALQSRLPAAESTDQDSDEDFYPDSQAAPRSAHTTVASSRRSRRDDLRPWTDEDRAFLRALHSEHLPIGEMAQRLNRTGEAVSNMSRRLGLRRRDTAQPWNNTQLRVLHRMLDDGASLTQIAEATGHPRSSVADKLRRLNIKSLRFRKPWTDEERRTILAMHATGASLATIAKAVHHRSVDAVQQKLQELVGPAPFRSTHRPRLTVMVETTATATPTRPTAPTCATAPPPPPSASKTTNIVSPSLARAAVRLILERTEVKPVFIRASVDDLIRWLRTRDFMVLHRTPGWQIDRHLIDDETTLLEFVNVRRHRLNLPAFVMSGMSAAPDAERPLSATN